MSVIRELFEFHKVLTFGLEKATRTVAFVSGINQLAFKRNFLSDLLRAQLPDLVRLLARP